MQERKKRLLASAGATVLIHIAAAAALGVWGIHFYNRPPTEVLEVDIVQNEPPPAPLIKKGSEKPIPEPEPEEEKVEEKPVERFTKEDIPDPEREAPPAPPRRHSPAPAEGAGDPNGSEEGDPEGDPNGSPEGQPGGEGQGGGETIGPQILSAPKPSYPSSARKAGVTGTVVVGLTISADGSVTSAWVESSSGNGDLDQAAVNGVYRWKFLPAKQNGFAITVNSRVPVRFDLH